MCGRGRRNTASSIAGTTHGGRSRTFPTTTAINLNHRKLTYFHPKRKFDLALPNRLWSERNECLTNLVIVYITLYLKIDVVIQRNDFYIEYERCISQVKWMLWMIRIQIWHHQNTALFEIGIVFAKRVVYDCNHWVDSQIACIQIYIYSKND